MGSIGSSEDNGVVADMSLLICFCGLARTFTTEIVQNGNILTNGNSRAKFEFEEWDVHQFNDDGKQMCKEFRRRAISNCMSHAIGNTATGFTTLSLEECISSFDHMSSLVRHNSHKTRRNALDYTKEFVGTMIARETTTLGLHRASMRERGGVPGRTPIRNHARSTAVRSSSSATREASSPPLWGASCGAAPTPKQVVCFCKNDDVETIGKKTALATRNRGPNTILSNPKKRIMASSAGRFTD